MKPSAGAERPINSKSEFFQPKKLKSLIVRNNGKPFKIARKLALSKVLQECTITCPETGIVSIVQLPAIPGFTLIQKHPLADIDNCRGLAGRGRSYLSLLDSTVLAGIFLCYLTEYELARKIKGDGFSGPSDNAVLRTISKESLIEGILLLEKWVHSMNAIYIPRISLIPQDGDSMQSMAGRITEWIKLAHDAIIAPDTTVYNPKAKIEKVIPASMQRTSVIKKQNQVALTLARKELRQDCKEIKELVQSIEGMSLKLKNFVLSLSNADILLSADSAMIGIIAFKLETMDTAAALKIAALIKKDRKILKEKQEEEDNPFAEIDSPESNNLELAERSEAYATHLEQEKNNLHSVETQALTEYQEQESGKAASVEEKQTEPEPDYAGMSFIQKTLARKAWLNRIGAAGKNTKTLEVEAEVYSIPAGTIIGSAPLYIPSPEKVELEAKAMKWEK